jgi:hypothetical protein
MQTITTNIMKLRSNMPCVCLQLSIYCEVFAVFLRKLLPAKQFFSSSHAKQLQTVAYQPPRQEIAVVVIARLLAAHSQLKGIELGALC